jgi:hypothetical protein
MLDWGYQLHDPERPVPDEVLHYVGAAHQLSISQGSVERLLELLAAFRVPPHEYLLVV